MANPRNTQDRDQFEETGKQPQRGGVGGKAEDVADEEETAEEMSNIAGADDADSDEHIDDDLAEEADEESEGEIGSGENERESR